MSTAFHRLARETPAYAGWRLPVALLLGAVIYVFAISIMMLFAWMLMWAFSGGARFEEWFDSVDLIDTDRPDFFALNMLALAIMIPVVLLAVFVTGPRPIGYLTSVEGRMRWGWLRHTSALAVIVFGGGIGALVAISFWIDPDSVQSPSTIDAGVIVTLVLVLALTPFQAAAEEYVFRGYLLQLVGSWTRFAWIPVVVSVPIFAAGHEYSFWGLVDVGLFGLMAAYLVIRTGGLEAAIAAHTFNNVAIMIFESVGMLNTSESNRPFDLIPTVVMNLAFIGLVERSMRRRAIVRTREPIPEPPPPVIWVPVPTQPYAPAYRTTYQPTPIPEWVPPANTPPYPGYLPPGWQPPSRRRAGRPLPRPPCRRRRSRRRDLVRGASPWRGPIALPCGR